MAVLKNNEEKRKAYHITGVVFILLIMFIVSAVSKTNYGIFSTGIRDYSDGWNIRYNNDDGDVIDDNVSLRYDALYSVNDLGIQAIKYIDEDFKGGEYLFIESDNQDIVVRIDGHEVASYGNNDPLTFGVSRPRGYFKIPLYSEYNGKQINIVFNSKIEKQRAHINKIYVGTEGQFISFLFSKSDIDIFGGALFIFMGFLWIVLYFVIHSIYKRSTDIHYIGIFGIMMGIYTLCKSQGRQIYIEDLFFAEKTALILEALVVIPCLLFAMERMKFRYRNSCLCVVALNAVNAFVCFVLDVLGLVDMSVSNVSTKIISIVTICYSAWAITDDCRKGHYREIKDIINGFSIIAITVLFDAIAILVYGEEGEYSNIVLYIGVIILMVVMGRGNILIWVASENKKKDAEHASKAKSTFLANMSHEIRTPISAILGMDEMILKETDNDEIKGYAANIRNAGNILLSIVNDILDFSKIESGKMELVETEYETVGFLNDVVIMMKKKAEDKGLKFILDISSDLPVKMYGDDVKFRQIITNIISNAVKYTRSGSVTLSIKSGEIVNVNGEKTISIHVSVKDTGIGIKEEDMSKLFDSFMRLDEKHNKNIEGTGLGMSITTYFLKLMKSELKVESVYGEGSEFSFDLNQLVLDESKIGNYENAYKKYETDKFVSHSGFTAPDAKILAVDDNEMNLEVLTGILKETEINITTTTRGSKAVELIKEYNYDLILLDHMMPGMDGIESLKKIREIENEKISKGTIKVPTPAIVLTANAISGAREMYLEAGFQEYLTKPIVSTELEKLIIRFIPGNLIKQKIVEKKKEVAAKKETKSADKSEQVEEIVKGYLADFGINIDDGIKYSAGKPGKYKLMLGAFIKFDPSRREKLKNAYDANDIKNYAIEAHALKSNARSVGANRLADMAYEHEKAGKASDEEFVRGEYRFLLEELDNTIKGIEKILKDDILLEHTVSSENFKEKSNTDNGIVPVSMSELVNAIRLKTNSNEKIIVGDNSVRNDNIKEIRKSVVQYDRKAALQQIKKWRSKEKNDVVVVALSRIENALLEFEFDKAVTEIDILQSRVGA